tara:strand:+ start:948 stop:2366 length:1419 start_codon:yes stop_codon:yes gene_type:complete
MNIPLILCGGLGRRLWPLSSEAKPKQFHKIFGDKSLFQETILRLKGLPLEPPIILTSEEYVAFVKKELSSMGIEPLAIICEPTLRDTAPAIISGALYALSHFNKANLLVLPSDHLIKVDEDFKNILSEGLNYSASDRIVTFGIQPTKPATGFGYIHLDKKDINDGAIKINKFIEKPDLDQAKEFLSSDEYLWNSGMFAFTADKLISEANKYCFSTVDHCRNALDKSVIDGKVVVLDKNHYEKSNKQSIDYAVMEKTDEIFTFPLSCKWLDAGSWNSLWEYEEKDEDNNAIFGHVNLTDSANNYIRNDSSPLVVAGITNSIIVNSKDGLLVATKSKVDSLKDLLNESAKVTNISEETNNVLKPWGNYSVYDLNNEFQLKSITVLPGHSLSLQSHQYREENWIVVEGEATVELDEIQSILLKGESIFIPSKSKHRLSNFGKNKLKIIEVQTGSYFGEDDIIRYKDNYGREEKNE